MSRRLFKGIDLSVYQGVVLEPCWQAMVQDDVEVAVVGSWHGFRANQFAVGNLARAEAAGLTTATYIVVNGLQYGRGHVERGRVACLGQWRGLSFAAIDVEVRGVTEEILDDALARVEELGGRPAIYTGRWFWNWWALELGHLPGLDRPGGVSRFTKWPLWTAFYDGRPTLDVPLYGGWERAVGHQYAGTTPAYGTQVDLNVFDAEWVEAWPAPPGPPPPPPEEVEMSSKEAQELRNWVQTEVHDAICNRLGALEGRVAALEGRAPAPPPAPEPRYYTVKPGDTASVIALRHGLSWPRFTALNPKGPPSGNWDLIYPGEKYRVA